MDRKRVVGAMIFVTLGWSGCAVLLLGAGAAGGYAISKDSVKNHYDLSQNRVYSQALAVAKQMGQILEQDAAHGLIRAQVGETSVTITVKPLTKQTVELRVKARKMMLPDIEVAQQLYNKINQRL